MNNALRILLLLSVVAVPIARADDLPVAKRPNILILLADQFRASATGYAGDPNAKTPNLDRLAGQSLNFRRAVSVCPVCTPFRAALLTGKYPTSTGMIVNDAYLPSTELCMAEILKPAGYETGYIGKWHLDGHGRESFIPAERRQGFDYWKAAECDHEYNHSHYYTGDSPVKQYWEGYDAYAETADAQQYIRRQAKAAKPFLLVVAYGVPHFPHGSAPPELKTQFPPGQIKLPPNVPPEMIEHAQKEAQGYYAHCAALDRCIGDMVTTLSEAGIADDTIVIFSSDHGEMLGSHAVRPTTKQIAFSESAGVPFLLRYPAAHGAKGRPVDVPITTPDVMPTLLSLAGIPVPPSVEGEDLSKLVRGQVEMKDRAVLYEGVAPFAGVMFSKPYRALRTSRYTYVRGLDGPWMLFDDEKDPYQVENLVGKADAGKLQEEMDARLQALLKQRGDAFKPAQYYLDFWGFDVRAGQSISYAHGAKSQTPHHVDGH